MSSGHSASLSLGNSAAFQAVQRDSGSASPAMYPGQQQQTPQQQPSPSLVGQGTQDTGSSAGGPQREGQIRRGVCKFFNSQKGFGFVLDSKAEELGGQEVFVHFTAIQSKTGFRSLAEGEEVEYEITTGPKGFQAVRLTGPGGRPVIGDPKARMMKNAPLMQLAPFPVAPYGMEPYVQQHPMYAASPYTQHLVYVPQAMHPQQAQYAQMMGGAATSSPQFTPQMAANFGAGGPGSGSSGRQALMAAQQQAQQQQGITSAGTSPSAPGSFQQQQQGGPFGPMSTGQPGSQAGFNNPGSRFGGGASSNIPAGSFGNLGMGGSNSSGNGMFANPGLGLNPARSEDPSNAPSNSSAFFGSGNLLYSSN